MITYYSRNFIALQVAMYNLKVGILRYSLGKKVLKMDSLFEGEAIIATVIAVSFGFNYFICLMLIC